MDATETRLALNSAMGELKAQLDKLGPVDEWTVEKALELWDALDEHMLKGGKLPLAWPGEGEY